MTTKNRTRKPLYNRQGPDRDPDMEMAVTSFEALFEKWKSEKKRAIIAEMAQNAKVGEPWLDGDLWENKGVHQIK